MTASHRGCPDGGRCVDPSAAHCVGMDNPHACPAYRADPILAGRVRSLNATLAPVNPYFARMNAAVSCHHRHDPRRCGCSETAACDIGFGDLDGGRTATRGRCYACPITAGTAGDRHRTESGHGSS